MSTEPSEAGGWKGVRPAGSCLQIARPANPLWRNSHLQVPSHPPLLLLFTAKLKRKIMVVCSLSGGLASQGDPESPQLQPAHRSREMSYCHIFNCHFCDCHIGILHLIFQAGPDESQPHLATLSLPPAELQAADAGGGAGRHWLHQL